MSFDGFVTENDIAGLGIEAFRIVVNRLLKVEASAHDVPLANLDLTLREHDPDGGVDARVKWPIAANHDVLVGGENVFQYKTGAMTRPVIEMEFNKPGVQGCLSIGGHYLLLISQDFNPQKMAMLRKILGDLCTNKGFAGTQCQILAASQIAKWVCRHPAIIAMRELGKGFPGFLTVQSWRAVPSLRNPWRPDAQRTDIESRVKTLLLQSDPQDPVIRIEGPAGAGKTRLALECIASAGVEDRTIYCAESENSIVLVLQLLTAILNAQQARAIVVVDECDRDHHNVFKSHAELAQGRIRLLCVGPGDLLFQSPAEFRNVFVISPMGESDMREILTAEVHNLPAEVTEIAVRLAGGYPKLAFFITTAVQRDPSVTPNEIRETWDIRGFLKKFLAKDTVDALRALSLFERLGWEDELKGEATVVAEHVGISFTDFQKGVKTLRDQGVVLARGRYLYVTPELLALQAAADLWEERGVELIGIIEKLPGLLQRRELLKRLAAMGRHPGVKKVVERLLGDNALFGNLGDLDEEFRGEAFRILASALPDAALKVLDRLIEPASRDQLLGFRIGRRNVIGAIETLLRWPTTSLRAARSLRALALAENEGISNNATGIFAEYFQIYLSRSPISYDERLQLVDELIEASDEYSRFLAQRAVASGLSSHEMRFGGNVDELAKRPYPSEWRPLTRDELWTARRSALSRLERIAKGADSAAEKARESQASCIMTLMGDGMFDEAIRVLDSATPQTDKERRSILSGCLRLLKDAAVHLSDSQKDELTQLQARLFDSSYFGRLKRWVGRRLYADYNLGGDLAFSRADEIVTALADEGFADGISEEEIAWLASSEAENAWVFGLRLGTLDDKLLFFDRLVDLSSNDINAVLLAAYLSGCALAAGNGVRERLLDQLATTRPLIAFGCTWRGDGTEQGFQRIVGLIESGKVPAETLGVLVYGAWTKPLAADEVAVLVRLMLSRAKEACLEPSMTMLQQALEREPDAVGRLDPLVWELLESTPPDTSVMAEWHWGQLSPTFAARNPARMVTLIATQYSSPHFIAASAERQQALRIATQADPVGAWNIIGDAVLNGGDASYNLLALLRAWFGELIPVEHLVSWAKDHNPNGPRIVARLIMPTPVLPGSPADVLVSAFPGDEHVYSELWGNVITGTWAGRHSAKTERDLSIFRQWAQHPNLHFRVWAKSVVEGMEGRLRQERVREEEGHF